MQSLPIFLLLASAAVSGGPPDVVVAKQVRETPAATAARGDAAAASRAADAHGSGPAHAPVEDDGLVRLTAVVTDRRGRPVAGLKPGDFTLVVDGTPQTVATAELSTRSNAAPRILALLLDEFHVADADSAAVRASLLRFVNQHLHPNDLVMVVKPLDSLDTLSATTDRQAIRDAIATFQGRKGDYTPLSTFERNYMAQAPAAVASARAQIVTSALRAISTSLSQKDGIDTAIVLVSDGFSRMRTSRDLPANLQAAVRIATRAEAPIYAFAPSPAPPAADEAHPGTQAFAALEALSTQTGGQLVTGTTNLDAGLAVLARDLDTHYVLTYHSSHGRDGRFHEVRLGVEREGAQVRARAGYVAPAPPVARASSGSALTPLRVLRRSALIQSWAGFSPTSADRGTVTVTWEPATARGGAAPRNRASTIAITASTHDGTVLFDGLVSPAGAPAAPDMANAATFEAPLGPVRVDMKILDASGVVIDTDARDVTAPNARQDRPMIFSPAVVRTRSAREFREAIANVHAAPVATREFRRTERLLIRVPAFDASGIPTPVSAVLLNRLRQPMRELTALDEQAPHGTTQFDLLLAPLAPGDYSLRLTATSQAGTVSEYVSFQVQR